jgi:hypothetical protein
MILAPPAKIPFAARFSDVNALMFLMALAIAAGPGVSTGMRIAM